MQKLLLATFVVLVPLGLNFGSPAMAQNSLKPEEIQEINQFFKDYVEQRQKITLIDNTEPEEVGVVDKFEDKATAKNSDLSNLMNYFGPAYPDKNGLDWFEIHLDSDS